MSDRKTGEQLLAEIEESQQRLNQLNLDLERDLREVQQRRDNRVLSLLLEGLESPSLVAH